MTPRKVRAAAIARLVVELMLAAFAIWLVVQNALLLYLEPWADAPRVMVMAGALLKVGRMLLTALWPWPLMIFAVSAMLGTALAARLLTGIEPKEEWRA